MKENEIVYSELLEVDIKTPTVEEVKQKEQKEIEKREKIKEERKERKNLSIQDELEAEDGKVVEEPIEGTQAETKHVEEKAVEEKKEAKTEEKKE